MSEKALTKRLSPNKSLASKAPAKQKGKTKATAAAPAPKGSGSKTSDRQISSESKRSSQTALPLKEVRLWDIRSDEELVKAIAAKRDAMRAAAVQKLQTLPPEDLKWFEVGQAQTGAPATQTPAQLATPGGMPYPAYLGPYTPQTDATEMDVRKRTVLMYQRGDRRENLQPILTVLEEDQLQSIAHLFQDVVVQARAEQK